MRLAVPVAVALSGFSASAAPSENVRSDVQHAASAVPSALTGQARVLDGDTLEVNGQIIRLLDIDAPELAQKCLGGPRAIRDCGKVSADALEKQIGSLPVQCVPTERDAYDRLLAYCSVIGVDLSTWSVASGWSSAFVRYSDRLVPEEQAARAQKLGIWSAKDVQAPWEYRQSRWKAAAQTAPDGCPIKGNISRNGEKIYHVPWNGQFYDRTQINTSKGERWFCSEGEAVNAGWRASIR